MFFSFRTGVEFMCMQRQMSSVQGRTFFFFFMIMLMPLDAAVLLLKSLKDSIWNALVPHP